MGLFTRKKKEKPIPRIYSLPLLCAIPCTFVVGWGCFYTLYLMCTHFRLSIPLWGSFLLGFAFASLLLIRFELGRTKTLIHELKHAVMVVLTGNILKGMRVSKYSGEVKYEIYEHSLHTASLIALAPYFMPLFSFPTLVAALIFENGESLTWAVALGAALGLDLTSAFNEMRPEQTDFRKILGGFLASGCYLAGFHFMWVGVCALWLMGGRAAYIYSGRVFLAGAEVIATRLYPGVGEQLHQIIETIFGPA